MGLDGGRRTPERQRELVAAGKSWTLNSKHVHGLAVDLYAITDEGEIDQSRLPYADLYGRLQLELAPKTVTWGGNWRVQDLGHYEIDALELVKAVRP